MRDRPSRFPRLRNFHDDGSDQAQAGGFVRKQGGDTRPATNFPIEAFGAVGGVQWPLMSYGKIKDGKYIR